MGNYTQIITAYIPAPDPGPIVKPEGVKRISVDFDGVIHSFANGFTGHIPFDPPVPGAREFITWLLEDGWGVYIFTARARQEEGRSGVKAWLRHHGFPELLVTCTKHDCDIYLDDRGIRFLGDWDAIKTVIKYRGYAPWHRPSK